MLDRAFLGFFTTSFYKGGSCSSDAEGLETSLRPEASSLCHLLLLPAPPVSGHGPGQESLCSGAGGSPGEIRFLPCGLRGHARPRASLVERTAERDGVEGFAGPQTARVAEDARKE